MASVSIKDVATLAGVSVGTVSNVLNRPATVRATTRAKVESAIAKLGFVPNASARQLAAGRSRTLAYLVLDAANPFFTDVARGIEEVAKAEGLTLFICNSDLDAQREDQYLEQLTELRARGVLITAMDYANPRLQRLRVAGVPVVLVDRAPEGNDDWCTVGVDDVAGGALAVTHLTDAGHRHLAFVGGPADIPQVHDRHAGALKALNTAGPAPRSSSGSRPMPSRSPRVDEPANASSACPAATGRPACSAPTTCSRSGCSSTSPSTASTCPTMSPSWASTTLSTPPPRPCR